MFRLLISSHVSIGHFQIRSDFFKNIFYGEIAIEDFLFFKYNKVCHAKIATEKFATVSKNDLMDFDFVYVFDNTS